LFLLPGDVPRKSNQGEMIRPEIQSCLKLLHGKGASAL
jgi:hypothetical protein